MYKKMLCLCVVYWTPFSDSGKCGIAEIWHLEALLLQRSTFIVKKYRKGKWEL